MPRVAIRCAVGINVAPKRDSRSSEPRREGLVISSVRCSTHFLSHVTQLGACVQRLRRWHRYNVYVQ